MIDISDLDPNPLLQLAHWYEEAKLQPIKDPDAMVLATATPSGRPSARVVLYKGMNAQGIKFFTNYRSRKSKELKQNPWGALVFYWSTLYRQVRIEGKIESLSPAESDEYWNSRPRDSQIGALTSPQSSEIPSREFLETRALEIAKKFEGKPIPRPAHWGGFCLIPKTVEFWVGAAHRLHDRFVYRKSGKNWEIIRLAP